MHTTVFTVKLSLIYLVHKFIRRWWISYGVACYHHCITVSRVGWLDINTCNYWFTNCQK